MTKLKKLGKIVFPKPLRRFLCVRDRRFVLRRAMRQLMLDPHCLTEGEDVLSDLQYGWGNALWSASEEFLRACSQHAWNCEAPILERGSGLTTLVLGAIARKLHLTVWTLEHNEQWARYVRRCLHRYEIRSVRVIACPLRDYGSYCWYGPPLDKLPGRFALVVCDGHPHDTHGGRYGLLPVMSDRLPAGTTILLDDARRTPEREIAESWAEELGTTTTTFGAKKLDRYISITIPDTNCRDTLVTDCVD